jgi:hypothetical protein
LRCILGDGGRILQKLVVASHHRGPGGTRVGPASPTWQALEPCLGVESSGTFSCIRYKIIPRYLLIFRSSLAVFCVNPVENINSSKLMKTVSNNLLLYSIYLF